MAGLIFCQRNRGVLASIMKYFLNSKSLALIVLVSLAMWGYFGFLSYIGDPRLADSSLDSSEMNKLEILLNTISLLSLFYLWGCSVIHCFKNTSKFLGIVIAFVWPLIYFYVLYILGSNWHKCFAR